ncbi:bifunctional transcriptional activator/DNA repair enzyme AdaA [Marinagarivorans cellulosilyticus]|uniref:methylated-DNA--[protein]-cysteine S-methyltransferase n=1 Tax=Marinagarivorans cellulosilyticus TaxID=2721545 RepID=A0AAN1WH17_9GAMM|nr:methylated-DNA--[protein]-cysteine S-methyltransferase [Marinagarivorans cellulosilyticus]BCD97449.1 AraC family transcriptional regulator, regulatory protein of adaptative response / methylated-DNA-[protein]-cysteine methyltransferase [Marinagarivorans cellulosilyticus]
MRTTIKTPKTAGHYTTIAAAISYIQQHCTRQPSLADIAAAVHLSPHHLQRVFSEWAGVSPKKFTQYLSIEYAKQILRERPVSLQEASHQVGLSGSSRLHDLFINIEGMTPSEYQHGGRSLTINFQLAPTLFGQVVVASTTKGVCYMAFEDEKNTAFQRLANTFPNAQLFEKADAFQASALTIFKQDWNTHEAIKLHLRGTEFQLKVWQSLLKIPAGQLASYGDVAQDIQKPKAARAVGTAIGSNPIALLIPCHRVIQSSGKLGGYMWGTTRKSAVIAWEAAQKKAHPTDC